MSNRLETVEEYAHGFFEEAARHGNFIKATVGMSPHFPGVVVGQIDYLGAKIDTFTPLEEWGGMQLGCERIGKHDAARMIAEARIATVAALDNHPHDAGD